jgi:predicted transcriptional regulator
MADVDDERLQRIDAHLERGNELFERFIEADERNTRAFERNTKAFDDWKSQQEDMREFMREITLRVERTGREQARAIRALSDEVTAELRAQRGALLAVLDRLSPGDSGSAA